MSHPFAKFTADDLMMMGYEVMRDLGRRYHNGSDIELNEMSVLDIAAYCEVILADGYTPRGVLALAVEIDGNVSARRAQKLIDDAVALKRLSRQNGQGGHTHNYFLSFTYRETYRRICALDLFLMKVIQAQIAEPKDALAGRDLLVAHGGEELAAAVYFNILHHESGKPRALETYFESLTKAKGKKRDNIEIGGATESGACDEAA